MIYFFYFGLGLSLIIIQTTIIPFLYFLGRFYDLIIPLVLFLAAHRPLNKGIPLTLVIGFIMDCLSGGAFGLYSITYMWLYLIVGWLTSYVHAHSTILLIFMVAVGTLIENTFFIVTAGTAKSLFTVNALQSFVSQAVWAMITGAFMLIALENIQNMWNRWEAENRGK
ncbi:MAG: rod shape-determining protein MreD [Candidatus Magnetoglobus multicellularis str. Araruama]|uniref:Rod shape-determining protein MreD n=1 Tax=Candidatus Magnetoglobus multicellularis str. Araruama TaxID=890399 RepID=A0A1V1P2R2_9BACT|nr:MAG: rod shape-determining protein MreD [Candidatus Magnetoglobus multicellularis str. Araruama]